MWYWGTGRRGRKEEGKGEGGKGKGARDELLARPLRLSPFPFPLSPQCDAGVAPRGPGGTFCWLVRLGYSIIAKPPHPPARAFSFSFFLASASNSASRYAT